MALQVFKNALFDVPFAKVAHRHKTQVCIAGTSKCQGSKYRDHHLWLCFFLHVAVDGKEGYHKALTSNCNIDTIERSLSKTPLVCFSSRRLEWLDDSVIHSILVRALQTQLG